MRVKIIIDALMTIALIILMGYMITGDLIHEIIGIIMIILWIIHNILNRKWYAAFGKGRYSLFRKIDTVINILFLITVAGLIVSSLILSSYVFRFLKIERGIAFARILHMVSAYWCFVISSLHLGLHWSRVVKITKRSTKLQPSRRLTVALHITAVAASCFGIYAFIKQQLASYLFMRTMFVFFDFEQSLYSFFIEYICMMILFSSITYYGSALLTTRKISRELL